MHSFDPVAFFEPTTKRQIIIKWSVIIVLCMIGIFLFVSTVQCMCYYERVFHDAVYVEAVISASRGDAILSGTPIYEQRLSYTFDGKQCTEILYNRGRGASRLEDDGKTITVLIDKDNPAQLAKWIISEEKAVISLIVLSLALALLIYGIAVEFPAFRQKRVERQRRKYNYAKSPDYILDVGVPAVILAVVLYVALNLAFPHVSLH